MEIKNKASMSVDLELLRTCLSAIIADYHKSDKESILKSCCKIRNTIDLMIDFTQSIPEDIKEWIEKAAKAYWALNDERGTAVAFKAGATAMIAYKDREIIRLHRTIEILESNYNELFTDRTSKIDELMANEKEIEHLTARCEAAEKVIEISGPSDCEVYELWQELKNQQS